MASAPPAAEDDVVANFAALSRSSIDEGGSTVVVRCCGACFARPAPRPASARLVRETIGVELRGSLKGRAQGAGQGGADVDDVQLSFCARCSRDLRAAGELRRRCLRAEALLRASAAAAEGEEAGARREEGAAAAVVASTTMTPSPSSTSPSPTSPDESILVEQHQQQHQQQLLKLEPPSPEPDASSSLPDPRLNVEVKYEPASPSSSPEESESESCFAQRRRRGAAADMHTLAPARSSQNQPLLHHLQNSDNALNAGNGIEVEYPIPVPLAPAATPVKVTVDPNDPSMLRIGSNGDATDSKGNFECLKTYNLKQQNSETDVKLDPTLNIKLEPHPSMMITSELLRLIPGENDGNDDFTLHDDNHESYSDYSMGNCQSMRMATNHSHAPSGPKTWSQQDMESALDALRNHNMSLTKASSTYGIPSTTLWQRAHRLGIDTPKKDGPSKSWSEGNLHNALQALRTGTISANKASKAYGIPSSTLYKIARREGIRLAAPFNAAPTSWRPGDLEKALQSIRSGHSSVQRASTEFGIPTGTLYGRCKREGIELSRSNPTPWSEIAMNEALETVRVGQMSINQAAIHFNLPYSSLYGRFKRLKYDDVGNGTVEQPQHQMNTSGHEMQHQQQMPQPQQMNSNIDHSNMDNRQMYPHYHQPGNLQPSNHHPSNHHPSSMDMAQMCDNSEPNNIATHNNQDSVSIS